MRKLIAPILLVFFMFGLLGCGGCQGFDWKEAAKQVAVEWIKDKVIVAVGKYAGDDDLKDTAVGWVMENIEKAADKSWMLKEGLKIFNVEGAISEAWDYYISGKLADVAMKAGMDTDADSVDTYSYFVTGADFPELNDILLDIL